MTLLCRQSNASESDPFSRLTQNHCLNMEYATSSRRRGVASSECRMYQTLHKSEYALTDIVQGWEGLHQYKTLHVCEDIIQLDPLH